MSKTIRLILFSFFTILFIVLSVFLFLRGCSGGLQGITPSIDDKSKIPPVSNTIQLTPFTLWYSKIPDINLLADWMNSQNGHYFTCDNWVKLSWDDHCYDSMQHIWESGLLNCHRAVILFSKAFPGDYCYMSYTYDGINYYGHTFLITKQGSDYWLVSYSSGVLTVVKLTVHFQVGETPLQAGLNYFKRLTGMTVYFSEVGNYWFSEATQKIDRKIIYDNRHPVPGLREKL